MQNSVKQSMQHAGEATTVHDGDSVSHTPDSESEYAQAGQAPQGQGEGRVRDPGIYYSGALT